jgi:GH24 family phage-related lysozyme (muramidase)
MSDLGEALVAHFEGRRRCVYPDTRGLQTIGIGACVDPKVPGAGLCDEAIEAQFNYNAANARSVSAHFPHYAELDDVRKAALFSMAFQLGDKPLHWPNFMSALEAKDYKAAAAAGRDSDWWRNQTRDRAEHEMTMLETGNWSPLP